MDFSFSSATEKDLEEVQKILSDFELPFKDISNHLENFILAHKNGELIGVIGLEIYQTKALLRSLSVKKDFRNFGVGKLLVDKITEFAKSRGVKQVFLLTTTAEEYFQKFGFKNFSRKDVPSQILQTKEFASLCPSSAICLHKNIV